VLSRFKGKATGAENAPKLFDERRTGGRVTKNLVIRLLPKSALADPGHAAVEAVEMVHGEITASGQYSGDLDGDGGLAPILPGTLPPPRPKDKLESTFYGEIATFGRYDTDSEDPNKKFEGTVGVIRDISERKRLEQRKAELEQQLFHSKKMQAIGELAGGIAHDFNNLLGVISGYTEMISRKFSTLDPLMGKYTKVILSAINQAADLTGKLLAFARKGKYKNVPMDLHEIIHDTFQLLKHSIDRKIAIRLELRGLRSFIMGDPNQLKNALINIAINARDAMPEGGELIFTSENVSFGPDDSRVTAGRLAAGDYLQLSVQDTGVGMDEDVKERLFEPFFTTKGMGKGTGLGLACVYGIVESHRGLIEVDSAKGVGTTFTVFFPTIADVPAKAVAPASPSPQARGEGHILLIDDEKMVLDVTAETLLDAGYRVTSFQYGQEAIEFYREHFAQIDLVIVDMIMPILNGRECFREFKAIHPAVQAVISTGYSVEHDAELLTQEGVVGFLQKPYDNDKLFSVIEKALSAS
jgi:signal transduction histidine kinase/ActR/RegA family two-component response regulator